MEHTLDTLQGPGGDIPPTGRCRIERGSQCASASGRAHRITRLLGEQAA